MTILGWHVSRAPRIRSAYMRPNARGANARELVRGHLQVGYQFTTQSPIVRADGSKLSPYVRRNILQWLAKKPRVLRMFTVKRITARYIEVTYVE